MAKYMMVYLCEGEQGVSFSEDLNKLMNSRMDIECGLGGYAEIYERMETEFGREYRLIIA